LNIESAPEGRTLFASREVRIRDASTSATLERLWEFLLYPVEKQSSFKSKLKVAAIRMGKLTANAVKRFDKSENASFEYFIVSAGYGLMVVLGKSSEPAVVQNTRIVLRISVVSIGGFEVIGPCRAKVPGSLVRSAKLHRNPGIILVRTGLH
jgi:hypothetical protein